MISVQNLLRPLSGNNLFIAFAFMLFAFVAYAQQEEVSYFIVHKVKKKETLEIIAKRYDITTDQILSYNPFAKKGIRKRDKLKIPRFKKTIQLKKPDPKTTQHTVQPQETLWRIAYTYGITVDSLRVLNPQLKDTLSIGEVLQVPLKTADELASQYSYYTVLPREGFYRLEQKLGLTKAELEALNPELTSVGLQVGMLLKIPKIQSDTLVQPKLQTPEKLTYWDSTFVTPVVRIALMAPFHLSRIELDSIAQTQKILTGRNLTSVSLDFYAGMLQAADSLNKVGLSVELTVFDTENQRFIIEKILNENDFSLFDAIVGPFTPDNVSRVAQAMTIFNIPVISPLTTRDIRSYKTLFNTIPSKETLHKRFSSYIDSLDASTENPCVIIIADEDNLLTRRKLKEQFPLAEIVNPDEEFGVVKPEVIDSLLTASRPNWVFLETEKLNLITSMTSMLNAQQSDERSVQLLTHYRSATYDDSNISLAHLGNLRFTYPNYYHEKQDSLYQHLAQNYEIRFGKSPNRTALKGFDVMMDVALRIALKRTLFDGVSIGLGEQVRHRFEYKPVSEGGYQNSATYIIQHQGFETIEVEPSNIDSDSLLIR